MADYEGYVDGAGHLADAWKDIQENPNSEGAKYWKDRMGGTFSKEAFGKAHAKETNELITGEYQKKHGSGSTKITAGTETDFAKSSLKELEDYGVDDTQKIQNRKNREKSGSVSSGSGVETPTADPIVQSGSSSTQFEVGQNQYEYGDSITSALKNPDGSVASDEQFLKYLLYNPDLREHAEALGLYGDQAADWGRWHWQTFGRHNPARVEGNSPFEINDPGLKGQIHQYAEIPQVYKDLGLNTLDEVFKYSVGSMTPSELWEVRQALGKEGGADWSLESFDPEGWRYEADNPYAEGLLGGTLLLNKDLPGGKPIGQLVDEDDLRFLQDRYNDAFIRNDFPDTWVSPAGEWTGPKALEGYWNTMTNAYRDAAGNLRASWDRPAHGWHGFDSGVGIGDRGTGGGRGSGSGSQFGGGPMGIGGLMLGTPYTQPAPQDWSGIMPTDRRLQSQRELVDNQGLLYQPWASGQAIAPNLLNYQIPSGSPSNPIFDPSLASSLIGGSAAGTGTGTGTITNDGSGKYIGPLGGEWDSYHDWYMSGTPDVYPPGGHYAALDRIRSANSGGGVVEEPVYPTSEDTHGWLAGLGAGGLGFG